MNGLAAGSWVPDRFGERAAAVDADGRPVELRRLPQQFNVLEPALAAAIARLREFDRPSIARVLGLEIDDQTGCLVLVSEPVPGLRLADLLKSAGEQSVVAEIGAALFVMRRLLSTLEALHAVTGLPQFAVAPESIVITPGARVVIAEPALGVATVFSSTTSDVAGVALVGMTMMLGREIDAPENIDPLSPLLQDVADLAAICAGDGFSTALRLWFDRAVINDPGLSFADFRQARLELKRIKLPPDSGCVASRRALNAFLTELAIDGLTDAAAFEADRARAMRARLTARQKAITAPDDEWISVEDEVAPPLDGEGKAGSTRAVESAEEPVPGAPHGDESHTWYRTLIEQFRAARESAVGPPQVAEHSAEAMHPEPPVVENTGAAAAAMRAEGPEEPPIVSATPELVAKVSEGPVADQFEDRAAFDAPGRVVEAIVEPAAADVPESVPEQPDASTAEPVYDESAPTETAPTFAEEADVEEAIQEPVAETAEAPATVDVLEPAAPLDASHAPMREGGPEGPVTIDVPEPVAEMVEGPVDSTGVESTLSVSAVVEQAGIEEEIAEPRVQIAAGPPTVEAPVDAERDEEVRSAFIRSLTEQLGLMPRQDDAPEPVVGVDPEPADDWAGAPIEIAVPQWIEAPVPESAAAQPPRPIRLAEPDRADPAVASETAPAEAASTNEESAPPPRSISAPADDLDRWSTRVSQPLRKEDDFLPAPIPHPLESVVQPAAGNVQPIRLPPPTKPVKRRKIVIPAREVKRAVSAGLLLGIGAVLIGGLAIFGRNYYIRTTMPGSVVVESTPRGSQVLVDGAARGVTPLTLSLAPGRHVLELRRGGARREISVNVTPGGSVAERVDWSTVKATGDVAIASTPSGARVIVDGKERGVTPLALSDLAVGTHTIVLESSAGTVRREVKITAGALARIDEIIISGWIAVFAPFELQIYERQRLIGSTETERIMMPPGRHELELVNKRLGYRETRTIDLGPGETVPINVTGAAGVVQVNAPPGAEVFIDGKLFGETPIRELRLPLGTHEILVRHPQRGEQRVTTTVTFDAPTEVNVDFKE